MTEDPVIAVDCQLSCIQVLPKSYIQSCYVASSMYKKKNSEIFCCMLLVAAIAMLPG